MAYATPLRERVPLHLDADLEAQSKDPKKIIPTFYHRPPTEDEIADYRDLLAAGMVARACLGLLRATSLGWDDFFRPDGTPVPWTKGSTEGLQQEHRYELAKKVDALGDPDAADLERSASRSWSA